MAYLNPIQVLTPTSFCYVASTNVRISLLNFLTFSFNPFTTLVLSYKAVNSVSPKSLNLNQKLPLKKWFFDFFLSHPYKIDLSHKKAGVVKLWSHDHIYNIIHVRDKILLVKSWSEIITS